MPLQLNVDLAQVELRKGHDGFLRGHPEPVLLWAVFTVVRSGARLVQSCLRQLAVRGGYPVRIQLATPALFRVRLPASSERLLLLALAFERDSGDDIKRVAQQLVDAGQWSIRAADSLLAAPFRLHELALVPPGQPPEASPVRLSYRDEDLATSTRADDWVSASMVLMPGDAPGRSRWTMRLVADDRRNDWRVQLAVQLD